MSDEEVLRVSQVFDEVFQEESDELLHTVWSLVMVRNQLPAQVVKRRGTFKNLSLAIFRIVRDFFFLIMVTQRL